MVDNEKIFNLNVHFFTHYMKTLESLDEFDLIKTLHVNWTLINQAVYQIIFFF